MQLTYSKSLPDKDKQHCLVLLSYIKHHQRCLSISKQNPTRLQTYNVRLAPAVRTNDRTCRKDEVPNLALQPAVHLLAEGFEVSELHAPVLLQHTLPWPQGGRGAWCQRSQACHDRRKAISTWKWWPQCARLILMAVELGQRRCRRLLEKPRESTSDREDERQPGRKDTKESVSRGLPILSEDREVS